MSSWAAFIESAPASDHVVQIYDDVRDLAASVGSFLDAGFTAGAPAVVIATAVRWPRYAAELEARERDPDALERTGKLRRAEAEQLLEEFMEAGLPSRGRFEQVVGGLIDQLAASFPNTTVRAFGEMVDVLVQRGEEQAALVLEELWNDLARRRSVALLCGYRLDIFDVEVQKGVLPELFKTHSHVRPVAEPARLAAAVDHALAEVVGPVEAARIYLDVASNVAKGSVPRGQAVLGWLSINDSPVAATVLERARSHYGRLRAPAAASA